MLGALQQEFEMVLASQYPGRSIRIVEDHSGDHPHYRILAVKPRRIFGFLPWLPDKQEICSVTQSGPIMYDFYPVDPLIEGAIESFIRRNHGRPYIFGFKGPEPLT